MTEEKVEAGSATSSKGPLDRAAFFLSSEGALRHRKKIKEKVGHDPEDTSGRATNWGKVGNRLCQIGGFFAGGFAIQALDAVYARTTRSERIIGTGSEFEEGTTWLNPQHVLASIEEGDDNRETRYRGFIDRYFGNCNLWEMLDELEHNTIPEEEFLAKAEKFRVAANNLQQRLYKDSTEWHASVRSARAKMEWVALLISVAMTVVGGVTSTQPDTAEGRNTSEDINVGQLFTGIGFAGFTKILSKHIETVDNVAQGIDKVLKWFGAEIVTLRAKLKQLRKDRGIAEPSVVKREQSTHGIIHSALVANHYRLIAQAGEGSIYDAISDALAIQDIDQSIEALQRMCRNADDSEAGNNLAHVIDTLANALHCPIFVLSEEEIKGEHYHLFHAPAKKTEDEDEDADLERAATNSVQAQEEQDGADSKAAEEEDGALHKPAQAAKSAAAPEVLPEKYLVLYSPMPGSYRSIAVPTFQHQPARFDYVRAQLEAIGKLAKPRHDLVLRPDSAGQDEDDGLAVATAAHL